MTSPSPKKSERSKSMDTNMGNKNPTREYSSTKMGKRIMVGYLF